MFFANQKNAIQSGHKLNYNYFGTHGIQRRKITNLPQKWHVCFCKEAGFLATKVTHILYQQDLLIKTQQILLVKQAIHRPEGVGMYITKLRAAAEMYSQQQTWHN